MIHGVINVCMYIYITYGFVKRRPNRLTKRNTSFDGDNNLISRMTFVWYYYNLSLVLTCVNS